MMNDEPTMASQEEMILSRLGGKFKHLCPDWDFMAIDEICPEFDACLCYLGHTSDHRSKNER